MLSNEEANNISDPVDSVWLDAFVQEQPTPEGINALDVERLSLSGDTNTDDKHCQPREI